MIPALDALIRDGRGGDRAAPAAAVPDRRPDLRRRRRAEHPAPGEPARQRPARRRRAAPDDVVAAAVAGGPPRAGGGVAVPGRPAQGDRPRRRPADDGRRREPPAVVRRVPARCTCCRTATCCGRRRCRRTGSCSGARRWPASRCDEILAGLTLPPDIWRIHTGLGFATRYGVASEQVAEQPNLDFEAIDVGAQLTRSPPTRSAAKEYGEQLQVVAAFRDALPEARRVFANIATYMICDDHEITDDWNLSQLWKDRVLHVAPRAHRAAQRDPRLLRVPGMGQRPGRRSTPPAPRRPQLLDALPGCSRRARTSHPSRRRPKDIDLLLGLDGKDPPVTWHYRVDGPKHRVLVHGHPHAALLPRTAWRRRRTCRPRRSSRSCPPARCRPASRCCSSSPPCRCSGCR